MTTTQRAVCALIRAALFDGPKELPEQTDLKAVCQEIRLAGRQAGDGALSRAGQRSRRAQIQ